MNYINRMKDEITELQQRILSAKTFMSTDTYKDLSEQEIDLLAKQRYFMEQYAAVLEKRIQISEEKHSDIN